MRSFVKKVYEYLCQEYSAIVLVDLVNDRIAGYMADENGDTSRRIAGSYTEQMERIAELMAEEYVEEWNRLGTIAHIQGLLQAEDRIEVEYQLLGVEHEWQKAVFQVVEREAGVATHMILAHIPLDSIQIEKVELSRQLQQQKEQLEQQKEQLEDLLNRENQYYKAITQGAAAIYEINLTQDILHRAFGYYQNKELLLTEQVGMELPCNYSQFVEYMAAQMPENRREEYLAVSARESLLGRFYRQERHMDDVYATKDMSGKRQYIKKTYILTQNESTGDIWALIIAKNVTLQQHREMLQREIIDGISTEFTSIYIIDWKSDTIRLFKTNNAYPTLVSLIEGVDNCHKVLQRYAEVAVHPEDREYVLRESDSKKLREALQQQKVVDINYRRVIDGVMDYAQMHCVMVDDNAGEPKIVMAFRSIDDIVKKEIAYLEEKERLTKMSRIDGLTGLLNKDTFQNETQEFLEHNSALNGAFIFLDVDHFKQMNDTLGHSVGDQVIQDVAKRIQVAFANCDLVGRFGGDEFCIFVKDIPRATLEERLAWALPRLNLCYPNGEGELCVTASIGCAYCVVERADYQTLLDLADAALYEAKDGGRNQFVLKLYK